MDLNEADPKKRTIRARLFDLAGNALPLAHAFAGGDLKIVQPDGTVADAVNLPIAVAGAAPGSFDIVIAQAELQQAGDIRVQLNAAGVAYWEWIEPVAVPASGGTVTVDTAAIAAAVVSIAGQSLSVVRVQPATTGVTSYDVGDVEPPMRLRVPFDGVNSTLALAVSAQLRWKKPDGTVTVVALDIPDTINSIVRRTWAAGDLAQAGVHTGEVFITWPGPRVATVQTIYQWTVRAPLA